MTEVLGSIPGYTRIFSGIIGSWTGSTQPREDNLVAAWYEIDETQFRLFFLS